MAKYLSFESEYGVINYIDTPWNSRVIGGKSLEIKSVIFNEDVGFNLISDFCSFVKEDGVVFISTRIPATLLDQKKFFLESGFHIVEHTLDAVCNKLDAERLIPLANRFPVEIESFVIDDLKEVQDISESEFEFGRFFEDPFIDNEVAKIRNRYWIEDLINNHAVINVSRRGGRLLGFIAYHDCNPIYNFVLGAVRSEYRIFAYSFWTRVLLSLKDVREIRTLISSSNINVINLYNNLGFRFDNPQLGFHKHLAR